MTPNIKYTSLLHRIRHALKARPGKKEKEILNLVIDEMFKEGSNKDFWKQVHQYNQSQ